MNNQKLITTIEAILNAFADDYEKCYQNEFFRESDIVWTIQKQIAKALVNTGYKVFHEYPVDPVYPLKLSKAKMMELLERNSTEDGGSALEQYTYDNIKSFFLNEHEKDESVLKKYFNSVKKNGVSLESIYSDLAIVKPVEGKADKETKPEIIIEIKYEADYKTRKGVDFRKNRTTKINSNQNLEEDKDNIDHCMKHPEIICGFFLFVDEANCFKEHLEHEMKMKHCGNNVWIYKNTQTNEPVASSTIDRLL